MSEADARTYFDGGWSPIPLPAGRKTPPPDGLTGWNGRYLTEDRIADHNWSGNIGLRLTSDVVGIDLDVYAGGAEGLAELKDRYGKLPPSPMKSSSRDDGSGIALYRVPTGTALAGAPAKGVQIVQWFHRYVVCTPSVHPDTGKPYLWHDGTSGEVYDDLAKLLYPGELPPLPRSWLDGLGVNKTSGGATAATPSEAQTLIAEHTTGDETWALHAIMTKLDEEAPNSRHEAMVRQLPWLAREAAAGWYPAEDAFARVEEWWLNVTDEKRRAQDESEFHRAVLWAIGAALAEPERVEEKRRELAARVAARTGSSVDPDNLDTWVDALLGQLLAAELRSDWRYVTLWRQWVQWNGQRWAVDQTEAAHERARRWMLDLGSKVLAKVTSAKDDRVRKVFEYRRASSMENVVKVARRILAVEPTVFDRHAHLLNVVNGVVDLRSGELGLHDPNLMMTRLAGAAYDPAASHPDVTAVFGCLDPSDVASVRMLLGVAATGHTGGDHLPVWDGTGSNGKTTLLLAASAALGDHAGPVPPELVMKSSREDHPTIKTVLHGLRLAYIEETEEDGGLRLERVKAITGGAPITARKIGGNYYEFRPSHTLILATNHRPVVNSAEYAAWRRLHLIPFPHRYSAAPGDRPVDAGLRDRLRLGQQQREAMLVAIVAGAIAAYAAGELDSPVVEWSTGIVDATEAWRGDEDVIDRFATSELIFEADARVTLAEMFARYKVWCEIGNRSAGQDKTFARRFEAHDIARQVQRITPQRRVVYVGVRLRTLGE